jgi:tetratricopeptide (TPR) repeat protein
MLCEELDYMPLAIEMAAARTKALAAEDILTRLSRRYGLLDKPLRGAAERHRSLDALVDWSYNLLDPPGQRVFERLSVVAGTFDVNMATSIAGFGDVSTDQVAGLLANLVERSLVARTNTGAFRMLRVLKSFAEQRLSAGDDASDTRTLHSKWFAELAMDIGEGLSTPEETVWIARANDAVEDLALGVAWATESGDFDTAQDILEGLFDWFYHRQPPAIIGFGDLVLASAPDHDVRAVASAWSALAALKRGEIEMAEDLAKTGTLVEGAASRFAWFMTGEIASHQQRLPEALDAYRKQRIRASNLRDPIGVIDSTAGEALALAYQGEYRQAMEAAADLERIAAEVGAPTYRAYADYAMGVSVADTDFGRARELLEDAIRRAESVNNLFIEALAKSALGSLLSRRDPSQQATRLLHEAMEIWENIGLPAYQWAIVQHLAGIIADGGDDETAGLLMAAAKHAGRLGLGPGRGHWAEITRSLAADERWERWLSEAESLDLDKVIDLALTSTQPRR